MISVRGGKFSCKFVNSLQMDRELESVIRNIYRIMVEQLKDSDETATASIHKQVDSAIKAVQREKRKDGLMERPQ